MDVNSSTLVAGVELSKIKARMGGAWARSRERDGAGDVS